MPMTAGSDAHIADMVGRAVTLVETDDRSVAAILDAIRAGKTSIEGRRTPIHISFRQAAGGTKRKLRRRLDELFR
jgi:predicted metal-dependent phosphoesterase TrpH